MTDVEVGMAVGGIFVENDVDVALLIETSLGVHAVKRINATTMSFFIEGNYMPGDVVASIPGG